MEFEASKLEVVHFPHLALRWKANAIKRVDAELQQTIRRMFELMYAHDGIGLAANQVGLPIQLFVVNLAAKPGEGEEHVFINPVLSQPKGSATAEEGCLSIPGVYGSVARPEKIRVQAFDATGQPIDMLLDGMFARVVQHEFDHLEGVLFPDRMDESELRELEHELAVFQTDFQSRQNTGSMPADQELKSYCEAIQQRYC